MAAYMASVGLTVRTHAAPLITIPEPGLDMVTAYFGAGDNSSGPPGVSVSVDSFAVSGISSLASVNINKGETGSPSGFLANSFINGNTGTGDAEVGIQISDSGSLGGIFVPAGDNSGNLLSANQMPFGQGLFSWGISLGTRLWNWNSDQAMVNISPGPASLFFIGIGTLFLIIYHRIESKINVGEEGRSSIAR